MFGVRWGLLGLVLVLSAPQIALSEEGRVVEVQSAATGQIVYEVVGKPQTKRSPGIYRVDPDTDATELLIPGDVLGLTRGFNGIYAQLDLTERTFREEAMAVVNGHLLLFSTKSKPEKADSVLGIGSETYPIFDPLSQHFFKLQPIVAKNDVQIYSEDRLVLVSVKQPNLYGQGITFGFVVNDEVEDLELEGRIFLVNYSFLSASQLAVLVSPQVDEAVYSSLLLRSLAQPKKDDSPGISKWRQQLSKFADTLPTDEGLAYPRGLERSDTIPLLHLTDGSLELEALPYTIYSKANQPLSMVQFEDPIGSRNYVYVEPSADLKKQLQVSYFHKRTDPGSLPGKLDFRVEGKKDPFLFSTAVLPVIGPARQVSQNIFNLTTRRNIAYTNALLTKVDGRFILTFQHPNGTLMMADLTRHLPEEFEEDIDDLQLVHLIYTGRDGAPDRHYLTLSIKQGEDGKTFSLAFDHDGSWNIRNAESHFINEKFYQALELSGRMQIAEQSVFFDATSKFSEITHTDGLPAPLTPLIDLNDGEAVHLAAIESKSLVGTSFVFHKFLDESEALNPTGIYPQLVPGQEWRKGTELVIPGELRFKTSALEVANPKQVRPSSELDLSFAKPNANAKARDVDDFNTVRVALFTIDQGEDGGLQFLVNAHLSNRETNTYLTDSHFLFPIKDGIKFDQLIEARFVRNRFKSSDVVTLVLLFRDEKSGDKIISKGGVYSVSFRLTESTREGLMCYDLGSVGNAGWVQRTAIDPALLKSHIIFDKAGRPLWLDQPSLDRTSSDFTVVQLLLADKGRTKLRDLTERAMWNETLRDDETKGWSRSDWRVYTQDHFEKTFPIIQGKTVASQGRQSEKDRKKKAELEELRQLFPNLKTFFSRFATERAQPVHEIVLVEPQMKEVFLRTLANEYIEGQDPFSYQNRNFVLYLMDSGDPTAQVKRELRGMSTVTQPKLLIVDGKDLVKKTSKSETEERSQDEKSADRAADKPDLKLEDILANGRKSTGEAEGEQRESDENEDEESHIPTIRWLAAEGDTSLAEDPAQISGMRPAIPMTIVMTPSEYRNLLEQNAVDAQTYLKDSFHVRTDLLTASWSLLPPTSSRASAAVKQAAKEGVTEDAVRVFPELNEILNAAANPTAPVKHQVIIFPDEQKALINRLIIGRWTTSVRSLSEPTLPNGKWNFANTNLSLVKIPAKSDSKVTQETTFENYAAIQQIQKSRRTVLIADLAEVMTIGRPDSEDSGEPFTIHDPSAAANSSSLNVSDGSSGGDNFVNRSENIPHLMWLLAAEGHQVQPGSKKGWTLKSEVPPSVPTILYGTKSEWEKLQSDLSFESRLVDFEKEFEVVELNEPPVEVRRSLLTQVLTDRPQLRSLGLQYQKGTGQPTADPSEVVSVLVARVDQTARSLKQNPTTAFIRVYSDLQAFISQDPTLRQTRLFDSAAIDRMLSRVFPIGIKIESLPANDYLRIVQDPVKAAIKWTSVGFRGYSDLKRRVAEMIFSQTESGRDDSRPMPNAAIFKGPTSTGKTYLLTTACEMMGLEPYDRRNPTKSAGYFLVKVQEIYDDRTDGVVETDKDRLTVSRTLTLIENFLSMNDRGIIILDDLHKAQSDDILRKLMTFISAMLEAPKGMFRVRNIDGTARDIPIRNAGLWITVNPTPDKAILERFEGLSEMERDILAGLSRPNYTVEASFLARIPNKFDMARFPAGAMVSSIISRVRESAQTEFISKQSLVMSSPHAIARLARYFHGAHAREILSPAAAALLELPRDLPSAPLVLIDLKNTEKRLLMSQRGDLQKTTGDGEPIDRDAIRSAIRDVIVYRPVDGQNVPATLDFMGSMIDSFRVHSFQALVEGMQENVFINESTEKRNYYLSEMMMAIFDSLTHWSTVPLNNVPMHPQEFGWTTQGKLSEYAEAMSERTEDPTNAVPFFFHHFTAQPSGANQSLLTEETGDRQILTVMSETAWKVRRVLMKYMAGYFRMRDLNNLPNPQQWVNGVRNNPPDPKKTARDPDGVYVEPGLISDVGREISEIYLQFTQSLFDQELLEYKNATAHNQPFVNIGKYDQARLFVEVFDKAIVSLPWPKVTYFVFQAMKVATSDHNMGYLPNFLDYMFSNSFSPFDTTTPDTVFQSITGHPNYKTIKSEDHVTRRRRYDLACQNMLLPFADNDEGVE